EVHNGNVIGSGPNATFNAPVNINPDAKEVIAPIVERLEKLSAQNKELAAQVAREKGVEDAPLRSLLVKLGEAGVHDEDIPKRLDAAAEELIKLRAEVEQFQHGPPALAAIAQEAQTLIDKGDLDGARKALVRGREAARAQRSDASRDEAKFFARGTPASMICGPPIDPPPRNMPRPPVSSRLSTQISNGISCSIRRANYTSRERNSATMPH